MLDVADSAAAERPPSTTRWVPPPGDDDDRRLFDAYFSLFPWARLPAGAVGFELGCGDGRWARLVSSRVGHLHALDDRASALAAARRTLAATRCSLHRATADDIPLADASMDFGYTLGGLHRAPDPQAGLRACVRKLKPGAPFLLQLRRARQPVRVSHRAIVRAGDLARRTISVLPLGTRRAVTGVIAACVYLPLARSAALLEKAGLPVETLPLGVHRHAPFAALRAEALDRFGGPRAPRFTELQIEAMMVQAGLDDLVFRAGPPHVCAVGYRIF
jgi:SAM-dependent methyltransferase